MDRSYFLRNLFIFLVFCLVLFLLIFGIYKLFTGSPKPAPTTPTTPVVKSLPEYASTYAEVSYMTDGHINGEDQHRAIKVTISQYQRKVQVLSGYGYNVIDEHSQTNNQTAYEVFLKALKNEGFTQKIQKPKAPNSETGQCPLGTRTILELNDSGDSLSRLWTSSCGRNVGTFGGNTGAIQSLFQSQITDYNKILSNSNANL
jgi:hypothetical protein